MSIASSPLPPVAHCWAAVTQRDRAAAFFYAVRSTGIYCRPLCSSRRPKRENVEFFADSASAESAGYRACRRCRPQETTIAPPHSATIQHALRILDKTEVAPSLGELAEAVGVSPFHLQRTFKAALGLSPRQYFATRRQQRLRAALRTADSVTDALYAAGYGSSRGLYEREAATLGMLPGDYRRGGAGLHIRYTHFDSAHGSMLLAATERGVCALRFGNARTLLAELAKEFPGATLGADDAGLANYVALVQKSAQDAQALLRLPLEIRATAFQGQVFALLRRIPAGETRSYSEIAEQLGQPRAVRAVARACASNPVALAIPCHRVVAKNGALAGYRWGIARKQSLLQDEAVGATASVSNPSPTRSAKPARPQPGAARRRH